MEAVRRRPVFASIIAGLVALFVVVFLSPAGDLVVPFVGGIAAVGLAVALYVALRRQRARPD